MLNVKFNKSTTHPKQTIMYHYSSLFLSDVIFVSSILLRISDVDKTKFDNYHMTRWYLFVMSERYGLLGDEFYDSISQHLFPHAHFMCSHHYEICFSSPTTFTLLSLDNIWKNKKIRLSLLK